MSAEQALAAFVQNHPEDGLAGNAQYWLGETFYVRGDFQTAARTFASQRPSITHEFGLHSLHTHGADIPMPTTHRCQLR